jgi:hypothetical protein
MDENNAAMTKTRSAKPSQHDPVYNVSSIFTAHRDLRPYAKLALGNSGLSVEEADILVLLYGLRELEWDDCPVDEDGFVTFKDLKSVLVHDPSLFARRIKKMAATKCGLVEVKRVTKATDPALHGNSLRVRITASGIAGVRPIWENFQKLSGRLFASQLLKGFSRAELEAHARINDAVSRTLREWRDPANKLL